MARKVCESSFGISIKRKVKYLGILLDHVTSEEAYAPVLARATLRAHFMSNLPLTQDERVALFLWVLPFFVFHARGYFPTDHVVAKLSVIYKVTLRLNSWGLTLPIMAMPPKPGIKPPAAATHALIVAARHTIRLVHSRTAGSASTVQTAFRNLGTQPRAAIGW